MASRAASEIRLESEDLVLRVDPYPGLRVFAYTLLKEVGLTLKKQEEEEEEDGCISTKSSLMSLQWHPHHQ